MSSKLFFSYPPAQFKAYRNEIIASITNICENGSYILGQEVSSFEKEFADWNSKKYAIGVGSGTDALILAMKALGIKQGDEVITVSHTALATVASIVMAGATPVLVDIEPVFYTIDAEQIKKAITKKTKAIIAVHLYGSPCDMDKITAIAKEHNLITIEDCAQAHGAFYKNRKVGTIGDIACFSFYPTKNLSGIGDGGAVITDDEKIATQIKALRQYGWNEKRMSLVPSGVSRLDELQAAILRIKLKYLDINNEKRRSIAKFYNNNLQGLGFILPQERENCKSVYHLYVIQTENRNIVKKNLANKNIEAGIHYEYPVHLNTGYKELVVLPKNGLPVTEKVITKILSLPMYPELNDNDLQRIVEELKNV